MFFKYCSMIILARDGDILKKQRLVAIVSEMIHTASLVHDDILGD